jgi:hypothetical protein
MLVERGHVQRGRRGSVFQKSESKSTLARAQWMSTVANGARQRGNRREDDQRISDFALARTKVCLVTGTIVAFFIKFTADFVPAELGDRNGFWWRASHPGNSACICTAQTTSAAKG